MIRLAEASGSCRGEGTGEQGLVEVGMWKLDAHRREKHLGCLVPSGKHL